MAEKVRRTLMSLNDTLRCDHFIFTLYTKPTSFIHSAFTKFTFSKFSYHLLSQPHRNFLFLILTHCPQLAHAPIIIFILFCSCIVAGLVYETYMLIKEVRLTAPNHF